jgi:hypothetical protein
MRWRQWLGSNRLTRDQREQDIEREIRADLELEADEYRDAGMTVQDARHAAERAFGNRTLVREEIGAIWGTPSLDVLLQDVRYAVRTMRRAPGFAAIAAGSSALGIGACTMIFAVLNFALLTPLPVENPYRLMSLSELRNGGANDFSYPDFQDVRQARSFEGMAAVRTLVAASIGHAGDPQRHWGSLVTANYFAVVKPAFALGRGFDPAHDDTRGAARVIVLSSDLWRQRFGADQGIVGRSVSINRGPPR